ncbi:MAG: hypothetical protein ACYDHP_00760 [Ferrimicrobium sp.]
MTRVHTLIAGVTLCISGVAWWEGDQPWQSVAAHVSILMTIAVLLVAALVFGRGHQQLTNRQWLTSALRGIDNFLRRPRLYGVCVLIWLLLIVAVIGWDLHSFLLETHSLPTLSYLVGRITHSPIGRSIVVALWLAGGCYLVLADRAPSHRCIDKPPMPGQTNPTSVNRNSPRRSD